MTPVITDGQTFVNAYGMVFTLLMGLLLAVLPRKYAVIPILAVVCYMTMGMRVVVGGLNFTMVRILLLFGWSRVIVRREFRALTLTSIDNVVIWYGLVNVLAYGILWGGEYESIKYKLGQAYDCLGFYFLFRCLIRDWNEVVRVVRVAAVLCIPLAIEIALERLTLVNQFAAFGGVPSAVTLRDGTVRCQGPFSHPILAGSFGAALAPWFSGLLSQRGSRALGILGILSAATITLAAGSSGPAVACLGGLASLCFWPFRRNMRLFCWAAVVLLISLHAVMKAPVWFLIGRASVYNASTGYHRAFLIDRAIAHFGDWWMVGTKTTQDWGWWLFDVTNHYVVVAVDGGILALALFIAIIVRCFQGVGRLVRVLPQHGKDGLPWFAWTMGATLVVHATSFISVSYFDQNLVMWYLLLAMISTLCAARLGVRFRAPKPPPLSRAGVLTRPPGASDFSPARAAVEGLTTRY